MVEVASFDDIAAEFNLRVARMVWASMSTIDRKGRTRIRIVHPIWDGPTGWISSRRDSFKRKHLANNPYVSLSYWDPQMQMVYVDATAFWADDPRDKERVWKLYADTPPPLGYDLATIWTDSDDPGYGLLKLMPWRIEIAGVSDGALAEPRVWRT
jgi:general stress protein 26